MPSSQPKTPATIYTVSELNRQVKTLLEREWPMVWVTGEISGIKIPISGHIYLALKDHASQIAAVMFRGQARQLKFRPEDGLTILGMGRLSVFEPRGNYQIILEYIEPRGVGALQIAFEQLKSRLAEEGLFDDDRKKPLPFLPRKIHVLTSPSGSVVFDIIRIAQNRFPNLPIVLLPVAVQGKHAADDIVAAVEHLNRLADAEVGILARGGGSIEDLAPFNDENVARAIFASQVPIVSAVGHETDFTIADFVADYRAPTPSAAAEHVVPEKLHLQLQCDGLSFQLQRRMQALLQTCQSRLQGLSQRMQDPGRRLMDNRLLLDDLIQRLEGAFRRYAADRKSRLNHMLERLRYNPLFNQVQINNHRLDKININLLNIFNNYISSNRWKTNQATSKLRMLNPRAILHRGYSITRTIPGKQVVKYAASVELYQPVEIMLSSGTLLCRVEEKDNDGETDL